MLVIDEYGEVLDEKKYILINNRELEIIKDIAQIIEANKYNYRSDKIAAIAIVKKYYLVRKRSDPLPESEDVEPPTLITPEESTT